MLLSRRRASRPGIREESDSVRSGEAGNDSCPLLGENDEESNSNQCQQIRDVRRIENGILSPKRSLTQRIRSRKNRFIQRALVACHFAKPSRDLTFSRAQTSNRAAIEHLTTIRSGLFAHSQSIVDLSMAICCFTGNSARLQDDLQDSNVVVEGHKIRECSLVFVGCLMPGTAQGQVEKTVLAKIDHHVNDLERVDALIDERARAVLEYEYAKRVLAVDQQKGNANRIAERKQALQAAQLECERATRFIAEQLKVLSPKPDADLSEIVQELVAQFFKRGAAFLASAAKPE
uniref:Uncharacterized protein n=1 Tax=Phytophthora ramorum TaxID=164328 RepID=H3GMX5_PHYRM